jgi:hypothetical protein
MILQELGIYKQLEDRINVAAGKIEVHNWEVNAEPFSGYPFDIGSV